METTSEKSQEELAKESAKVTMIWVATVSIVMLFAAFCSAFLVSKGGNFWVNVSMPIAFWMSTAVLILSSLFLNFSLQSAKKNKSAMANHFLALTLVCGIGFSVLQFKGWGQLMEKGNYFVGNIMNPDEEGFFVKGEYGRDFTISYNGMILNYENSKLFFPDGKELSAVQYDRLNNSRNTASSYIYILTVLHFLHLAGGLIYLIFTTALGYSKQLFNANNYLKIKLISIYWHFLGVLWIFLFLFLQFIH